MALPATIGLVTALGQSFKSLSGNGQVNSMAGGFTNFIKSLQGNKIREVEGGITRLAQANTKLSTTTVKTSSSFKNFGKEAGLANNGVARLNRENLVLADGQRRVNSGLKGASKSFASSAAASKLAMVGTSLLNGALIGLASAGIGMAISALDDWMNKLSNTEKEIKNTIDTIQGSLSKGTQDLTYLKDTEKRYNELIKKKKEYSNTPIESLSEEQLAEMQELEQITNDLAEMFPQLVVGYGEDGRPIMLMADDMEKLKKKTEEQIELDRKLLQVQREKLAAVAREQVQKGEMFGWKNGTVENIEKSEEAYNKTLANMKIYQDNYTRYVQEGNMKQANKSLALLKSQEKELQNHYQTRLKYFNEYSQKELTIQQSAFDQIQGIKDFDKLEGDSLSGVQQFIDSLNWANLDEGQYSKWLNSFDGVIDLANSGSPKLKEWNDSLQKANDEYAATGNAEKYKTTLSGLAKVLSEELNLDYDTVFSGLENMGVPLTKAEEDLNRFLEAFGKTRYDLLNGDSIAEGLAEQFQAINDVVNTMDTNRDFAFKANGTLSFDMMTEIANKEDIPEQIRNLASELAKGGVKKVESDIMVNLMMAINSGDKEKIDAAIKDTNEKLKELGMQDNTIDIKTLFDDSGVKGAEQKVGNLEDALNRLRKEKVTTNVDIQVDGQDKAALYLDIINKLKTSPELTNKFILENQDALSQLQSYEEIVKWLQQNPDIISKYKIQGIEGIKEAKEEKQELEKDGEAKTSVKVVTDGKKEVIELNAVLADAEGEKEVKVKVDNVNVLESIEDVETLIKMSSEVKDGKYKLDIEANTESAVKNLKLLEDGLSTLSGRLGTVPVATINIHTSLAAKNLSGLKTRIDEVKGKLDNLQTKDVVIATAQSAKNLSGLIFRVSQYTSAIDGVKSRTVDIHTSLAAKNLSGLIRKVGEYNDTKAKSLTISSNANTVANQVQNLINKIKNIPNNKSVTFSLNTRGSVPSSREIQAQTLGMQQQLRSGIESMEMPTPSVTPIFNTRAYNDNISISNKNMADSLKYDVELLKELENAIKLVNNQLTILDKKMEHATGSEKITYLKEQNKLYQEQLKIQKDLEEKYSKQKKYYGDFLKSKGFNFTGDGNLKNYEEKLLAMENELNKLEEIAKAKQKAQDSYKGDDEKKKDSLSKEYDKAKESVDKYGDSLDEIKKYLNEYLDVSFDKLPGVKEEFLDINGAIQDNINSMKEFEKEIAELREDSAYKKENSEISNVQNKLDKNEILLETAIGKERERLLKERIELQKQLQKETSDLLALENKRREGLMKELGGYGFTFKDDGSIEGYSAKIEKLKESLTEDEFNSVFEKIEDYLDTTYDKIPGVENDFLELGNTIKETIGELEQVEIEKLDKEIERAEEEELLGLLEKKLELQKELANAKNDYVGLLNKEASKMQDTLSNKGFTFNDDGSISNFEENIKRLQEEIKKTNDITLKDKLTKELQGALDCTKEYVKVTESEIPKAVEEWLNAQDAVKDTNEEIEEIEKQQAKFAEDRAKAVRKATEDIMKVSQELVQTQMDINNKQISILDNSMKLANFDVTQSYEALQKKIGLLEKQKNLQAEMNSELEKQMNYHKNRLVTFGIQFDSKGIATNAEKVLNDIKNQMAKASDEDELAKLEDKFNDIVGVLGDYNGVLNDIVDGQGNLIDLQLEIEGVYTTMLETTKKIEDKITAILEKQVEERKKLIDEELKKRLDAINKQKEAYNDERDKENWEDENEERLKELGDLQAKIDAISKDNSLAGQAKLAELLEELANKQEDYNDFIQDKTDKDINDMLDEESDRLTEEADKAKEELDKTLEKEELYETIKEALETGKLTDIDGNIIDLKDAIIDHEDKYGDGLSVIGGLIKKDLLSQLDISLDTMKNIEGILKKLNISDLYSSINPMRSMSVNVNSMMPTPSSPIINFNESLIKVEGSVTSDVVPELRSMVREAEKEITRKIINSMR